MRCGFLFRGPAVHAVAGQRRVTVGAADVAQNLVVSAIFANDQEAVLEARNRCSGVNCRRVGADHGLRRGRKAAQRQDCQGHP